MATFIKTVKNKHEDTVDIVVDIKSIFGPTLDEDGKEESTMILTATTRGEWLELEEIKQKIKKHFPAVGGLRAETDNGVIVVFYSDAFPVPTGEADLKRIQINLDVREWKGLN